MIIWVSEHISMHFYMNSNAAVELCSEKGDDKEEKKDKEYVLIISSNEEMSTSLRDSFSNLNSQVYTSPILSIPEVPPEL